MNNVYTIALRVSARGSDLFNPHRCPLSLNRTFRTFIPSSTSTVRQIQIVAPPPWQNVPRSASTFSLQKLHCRTFSQICNSQARSRNIPTPPKIATTVPSHAKGNPERKSKANAGWTKYWDPLDKEQLKQVFGAEISRKKGNSLLVEIQRRRITGSLAEEGLQFSAELEIDQDQALRGLEWLRTKYPLDEEAAAAQWAAEELDRLDEEARAYYKRRGQELRLYKSDDGVKSRHASNVHSAVDAGSVLVQRQKEIKKIREQEEKLRKEEEIKATQAGTQIPNSNKQLAPWAAKMQAQNEKRREEYRQYTERKAKEAEIDSDQIFAQRSNFSRLFPATLFGALFVYACFIFASSYEPPPASARLLKDIPPSMATFVFLFAINAQIFVLWRVPSAWKFLNRYFLLSAGHPRAFSVLGNTFSHQMPTHFASNMAILYLVGTQVHDLMDRGNFLAVYLSTGVCGSLGSLWYHVLMKNYVTATIGSSGALFGIIGCYLALKERHFLQIPFMSDRKFEYDGTTAMVVVLAGEIITFLLLGRATTIDHWGHIAGIVSGYAMGRYLKSKAPMEEGEGNVEKLS